MIRLLALLLLFPRAVPLHAADGRADEGPRIRVAIARNSPSLKLRTAAKVYVQDVGSGQRYLLLENSSYEIKADGGDILVAGQRLSSPIKLLSMDGQERIRLGGNLYKGDILLKAETGGKLDIIEYLPLEDYLYGVLPVEMSPDWPLEALKAQAVASRTYALRNMNPAKDYDITDGSEMQVYNGVTKINPRIIDAVNSTRGEVLKYKGKLVTAFFHACCGGHTASVRAAWGEDVIQPLKGVPDPFCRGSSHYRWQLYVTASDLLRFIQSQGSTALKIRGVHVRSRDNSGRALSMRFATDRGSVDANVTDLRKKLGTYEFRSTLIISITRRNGGYEFKGRGWGHGVGMCQDGAKVMAQKGYGYKKILHHYYPGASITDYD
jgi:stage II sporulation protein D